MVLMKRFVILYRVYDCRLRHSLLCCDNRHSSSSSSTPWPPVLPSCRRTRRPAVRSCQRLRVNTFNHMVRWAGSETRIITTKAIFKPWWHNFVNVSSHLISEVDINLVRPLMLVDDTWAWWWVSFWRVCRSRHDRSGRGWLFKHGVVAP